MGNKLKLSVQRVTFVIFLLLPFWSFSQQKEIKRIKLTWNSFTRTTNRELAYIAYTTHKTGYKYRAVPKGGSVSLTFEVTITLDTPKTLVNISRLNKLSTIGKKVLLDHEQGHTDLAVIYGRILYRKLTGAVYTTENFKMKTREIYLKTMKDLAEKNFSYDKETEHGFEPEQQMKWANYIDKLLRST